MVYIGAPPPTLPPGTPLPNGEGVSGRWLYTWSDGPQIAWEGWVPTGTVWTPTEPWMNSVQLQAYVPPQPPPDAPPAPEGGGTYTVIRVMAPGGWCGELARLV
jgi:hypothetical protein